MQVQLMNRVPRAFQIGDGSYYCEFCEQRIAFEGPPWCVATLEEGFAIKTRLHDGTRRVDVCSDCAEGDD